MIVKQYSVESEISWHYFLTSFWRVNNITVAKHPLKRLVEWAVCILILWARVHSHYNTIQIRRFLTQTSFLRHTQKLFIKFYAGYFRINLLLTFQPSTWPPSTADSDRDSITRLGQVLRDVPPWPLPRPTQTETV